MISKKEILNLINSQYPLHQIEIKEMAKTKVFPMSFQIEQYEAEGLGNVSFMSATGLFGLMKMDTMIVNPFELDVPLYSYDHINAMGNLTLIEELYDTRICKGAYVSEIDKVNEKYSSVEKGEVESKWYDSIRLSQSISKKGKKQDAANFDQLVVDYTKAYLDDCKKAEKCDRAEKIKASQVYTEGLLNNGGPSTDLFVKKKGLDYTKKLFREILFATKTPEGEK